MANPVVILSGWGQAGWRFSGHAFRLGYDKVPDQADWQARSATPPVSTHLGVS
jgi:hypothetical protein